VSRRKSASTRIARLVAVVAAAVVALTGCDLSLTSVNLPGGADLGSNPYTVKIDFRDVLDLVPQSTVKVDDVTVGKVTAIDLKGYSAEVTVKVRGDVDLPDNAIAEIRQTSLLGEKFVSLSPPQTGASSEKLHDGSVIPLDRTGRNPEVEEVLGALSLVLNGGGVAQLKTISQEVNQVLSGREGNVRSVLARIGTFMGRIDQNKGAIVEALQHVNNLSVSLNKQESTLNLALDNLPKQIASIDRQRNDLVKMLRALAHLSDVGTRVIQASKVSTIDSLNALAPTLNKLAEAGDAFPRALQIFLTYPFVDAVVGNNAQQARDLQMGDYVNLSIQLDLDLTNGLPTVGLPGLPGQGSGPGLPSVTLPSLPLPSVTLPTIGLPGHGTGAPGCLLPGLLCRVAPDLTPTHAVSHESGLIVRRTSSPANADLAAALTLGLVK
jgi:phospholipid/cholesterol/gamma-HCH transport system substrate-binding protein